ncbi:hypothetical protein [Saccharicrinis sp. FJH54]|uniref:hypothetical protein n=1 Tax=Saccharicrinis sp. FJH54 TaxID=3344665 RepID=UPI0035D4C7A6
MKRNMILLIGIFILIGCKQQKEKVANFIFNASKLSNNTHYFYKYDSDKLSGQTEKTYTIMFGQVVDSMITHIDFEYNERGLLTKEISQTDFDEKPTIKIYDYDKNDSLISTISINSENDTIFWEVYNYFPDGKRTIFSRLLMTSFDTNQDLLQIRRNRKYDTTIYVNKFNYNGNSCLMQKQYNKKNQLIHTINFNYQADRLMKEKHTIYFKDIEASEKMKYYDYSKSGIYPDFYSLDSHNDTIDLGISDFNDEHRTNSTEIYDYGNKIIKTFYENDKEIGMIAIDKSMNLKLVESYEYYEDGKLKESKSYHEELKHTNTRS